MKRLIACLLLFLFLLNILGFYVLLVGIEFRFSEEANRQLDFDNVRTGDLITLKVPLSLPYGVQENFVRTKGQFQYQGQYYRLVKTRYASDTLTIVCVRDTQIKKVNQALTAYVKTFADSPINGKHPDAKKFQSLAKDYLSTTLGFERSATGWSANCIYSHIEGTYAMTVCLAPDHPPRHLFLIQA